MSAREKLLRQISTAQFAAWELHLYLDTHPADMQAASMLAQYEKKYMHLKEEYEEKYGPLLPKFAQGVEWLKNPWPWENGGDCD
ncbi:MAG: spore coat protein CotJB [Clostridia bacterium]|nr:spore coat protein CotJB [Clostridia bacterium]